MLKLINPKALRISGTSWIPQGETRDLSLNALQAKVLCDRHNSAFSPLDEMAGRFFGTLAAYYDDLSRRSLSSKEKWSFFSGEELELWFLKTILGFVHSGVLTKDGRKIADSQTIMNRAIEDAYATGTIVEPCGMYVRMKGVDTVQRGRIEFTSLSDKHDRIIVGGRLTMMGLVVTFFTDPGMTDRDCFIVDHSYRPNHLYYENKRRRHAVVLTWPPRMHLKAVKFMMASMTSQYS